MLGVNLNSSIENWSRYISPGFRAHEPSVLCLGAGQSSSNRRGFNKRRLVTHAVAIVTEGRGGFEQWSPVARRVDVIAPAVIWVFPGVEHRYGPARSGWRENWVLFRGPGVGSFEQLGLLSRSHPVLNLEHHPEEIDSLFSALRKALDATDAAAQLRASLLTQRILLAIDDVRVREPQQSLLESFAASVHERIPMPERARRLGVSLSRLQRVITDASGRPPSELAIELRISRAQALLAESNATVATIAAQVGYDDAAYFSRLFTARVGVPPRDFRHQQRRVPLIGDARTDQGMRSKEG